jgi:SAM-dependent MidA family methyltransferase
MRSVGNMAKSIDAVYMVEASKELRMAQKNLLCGEDAAMRESKEGWHSTCKHSDLPIVWTDSIKAVPQDPKNMPFIVAHEFFDALPIHAFQVVEIPPTQQPTTTSGSPRSASSNTSSPTRQWREMVVSPTPEGTTHADLGTPRSAQHEPVPEFQLTLSPSQTRHALYVPETSPRYRALKSTPGSLIEVCPDASLYVSDFASRIGGSPANPKPRPSGAALILDYGPADTIPTNSLRGIRQHERVSPFAAPGLVDLSADVDFLALVEAATRASEGVECHGPVDQAYFLEVMGIANRAERLSRMSGDEAKKADIEKAWKRLVNRGPNGMGKVYKALAILPENNGKRRPAGFGGDVDA